MACKPIVFSGIDRTKFLAVRARVRAQTGEISLAGDAGTASGQGFTVQWTYSEPEQQLTIQCTDKPFIIPESIVAAKIRGLVEGL